MVVARVAPSRTQLTHSIATSLALPPKANQAFGIELLTPPSAAPPRHYASAVGDFGIASAERIASVGEQYLQGLKTALIRPPNGEVRRVTSDDLTSDLNTVKGAELQALLLHGQTQLSTFYYFTSGAGLWSRGGGQVKATVPFNLAELIPHHLQRLSDLSDWVNAKSAADVLFKSKTDVPLGQTVEETAKQVIDASRAEIDSILTEARNDLRAMTPLTMKLVQAAIMSRNSGHYVPFDVWTSEQTHAPIVASLERFKRTYRQMKFHDDPTTQNQVIDALGAYLDQGGAHVFGYQEGLPALSPSDGQPIAGTPLIGEGAGRAKAYLDLTGRTDELRRAGKTTFSFENIEVLTDWLSVLGAHDQSGKAVSVVVVPQKDGYAGGNPFMVGENLELHEQSVLPPDLASGNHYFNSNTIVQPLSAQASALLGFEVKNNHTQVRPKNNAGDITHSLPTGGIGGVIGRDYENFKTYPDYVRNGAALIETYRSVW